MNKKTVLGVLAIYTVGVAVTIGVLDYRLKPRNDDVKIVVYGAKEVEAAENVEAAEVDEISSEASLDEYTDLRRLDKKFLEKDDDFRWPSVREDIEVVENEYRITLDNEKLLSAQPGDIIREWSFNGSDAPDDRIVISVPKIYDCEVASNALKNYGVLEVFYYYEAGGQFETLSATARLHIYDKAALEDGQRITLVTTPLGNYTASVRTVTSIPMLTYWNSSEDYWTIEEAQEHTTHAVASQTAYFASNDWDREECSKDTTFTETSFNFGQGELSTLLERAERCNIRGRAPISAYYNENGEIYNSETGEYESGATNFSLTEFCNEITGVIAGKYVADVDNSNGFIFLYPRDRRDAVIAVNQDRIYIGFSSRPDWPLEDFSRDVENDRLYIGTYYWDNTKDPELIQIDGRSYLTLTTNTLNQLLHLLTQSNVNWSLINASNLRLDE